MAKCVFDIDNAIKFYKFDGSHVKRVLKAFKELTDKLDSTQLKADGHLRALDALRKILFDEIKHGEFLQSFAKTIKENNIRTLGGVQKGLRRYLNAINIEADAVRTDLNNYLRGQLDRYSKNDNKGIAEEFIVDVMQNSSAAYSRYGFSQTDLLKAIKDGGHPTNSLLNTVSRALKATIAHSNKVVRSANPTKGDIKDYIMSVKPKVHKVSKVSRDQFIEDMKEVLDPVWLEDYASSQKMNVDQVLGKWRNEILQSNVRVKRKVTLFEFARDLKFKDSSAEIKYLQKYSIEGDNAVPQILKNIFDAGSRSAIYRNLGARPMDALEDLVNNFATVMRRRGVDIDSTKIHAVLTKLENQLDLMTGNVKIENDTVAFVNSLLSKITSSTLTQFSGVRNIFLDQTLHSALSSSALDGKSVTHHVFKTYNKFIQTLVNSGRKKELRHFLKVMQMRQYIDWISKTGILPNLFNEG